MRILSDERFAALLGALPTVPRVVGAGGTREELRSAERDLGFRL